MRKVIFTNEKHIKEDYVPPNKEKPIDVNIVANPNIKYQKHLGFGVA